jgi:uncharacterized surface protein with fasciclin (FAS1) repeats
MCTHLIQSYSYNCTAPTDEAFNAILSDIPPDANLTDILLYHIDSGAIFSDDLFNNLQLTMLNGDDTLITTGVPDAETGIKINNSTVIPLFDVAACNGVVHNIDKVLIPHYNYKLAFVQPDAATDKGAIGVSFYGTIGVAF